MEFEEAQMSKRQTLNYVAGEERASSGRLSPKEQDFIADMVRWCALREPSEKQAKWLHSLYCKIGRRQ
jgi:hypothetical protein